jgi:hypothetical protein
MQRPPPTHFGKFFTLWEMEAMTAQILSRRAQHTRPRMAVDKKGLGFIPRKKAETTLVRMQTEDLPNSNRCAKQQEPQQNTNRPVHVNPMQNATRKGEKERGRERETTRRFKQGKEKLLLQWKFEVKEEIQGTLLSRSRRARGRVGLYESMRSERSESKLETLGTQGKASTYSTYIPTKTQKNSEKESERRRCRGRER